MRCLLEVKCCCTRATEHVDSVVRLRMAGIENWVAIELS